MPSFSNVELQVRWKVHKAKTKPSGEKAQGPGEGGRVLKEKALDYEKSGNLRVTQCGGSSFQGQGINEDRKIMSKKHLKGKVSMNREKVSNQRFTEKSRLWTTVIFFF